MSRPVSCERFIIALLLKSTVWWGTPLTDPDSDPNFKWLILEQKKNA